MHQSQQIGAKTDLDPCRLEYFERTQSRLADIAELAKAHFGKS